MIKKGLKAIKNDKSLQFIIKELRYIHYKFNTNKFNFILLPYAILKIKKFNNIENLNNLINFSFYSFAKLIKPMQVKEEIKELLKILKDMKPRIVLEIGTANGGTLFLFSRVASKDATLISIDLPGGMFGGGYPLWKIPLYKSFARSNQKIYLIRSDSHCKSTLEKVKSILNKKKVDFLFIDGDHTYEGVKKDFEMYSPLVRKGGIIALHDIVPGPEDNVGGVPKFWQEVKKRYKYKEIVKDWNQGGYGIGIIYK